MADRSLDYELLQVAGIGSTPKSGLSKDKNHRRRDSRDAYSSDDDDYRGRNQDFDSKIPPKKRLDMDGKDYRRDSDGSDSDPSFGSDLYKDDADREALSKKTELERELILAERGEERDRFLNKIRDSKRRTQSSNAERDSSAMASRSRASASQSNRSKDALNKLVESRSAKQKRQNDLSNRDFSSRRNLHQQGRDERSRKKQTSDESSASDSESLESHGSEGEEERDRHDDMISDDDRHISTDPDALPEDLQAIVLPRMKLFKWCWEPFFEELVVGCLVRVGIGMDQAGKPVYRVCEVAAVDAKDPTKQYKLEGRLTHKYLDCQWGDKRARWKMDRVSDKPPQRVEFEEWLHELDRINARRMTKAEVSVKKESLSKASSYTYDAVTVKQMLEEKRLAMSRPRIVAVEKDRLEKEMEGAKQKKDQGEMERIKEEMSKLEDYAKTQSEPKNLKSIRLAEMNKRNREQNFKIASDSANNAQQQTNSNDPFSRRWTRSQNYYRSSYRNEEKEKKDTVQDSGGETKTVLASDKLEEEAKPEPGVFVSAPESACLSEDTVMENVMWSKHAFDLPILLEPLQHWGGKAGATEAFLARKRKQEETFGVKLKQPPKCTHVLTINDYKRRRGLL